jgi:hypothetical protein
MKRSIPVRMIPAMLLFSVLSLTASAQNQMIRFHYYPKSNVYYEVSNKTYIFLKDDIWVEKQELPKEITLSGNHKITMYSMKREIWLMNEEHVHRYRNIDTPKSKKGKLGSIIK